MANDRKRTRERHRKNQDLRLRLEMREAKLGKPRLIDRIRQAKTVEELNELKKYLPVLTPEQIEEAHKRFDDGIYDENGLLIGEKHPDD